MSRADWKIAEQIVRVLLEDMTGLRVRQTPGSGSGARRLDLEVLRGSRVVLRVEVKYTSSSGPRAADAVRSRARRALSRHRAVDAPMEGVIVLQEAGAWRVHLASCRSCDESGIVMLLQDREVLVRSGRCLHAIRKRA